MKKHLLIGLAVLFFAIGQTRAQTIDFTFTVINASSDTACDGEMDVQCTGCPPATVYTWYDSAGNIIGSNNHVSGLCVITGYYTYGVVVEFSGTQHVLYGCLRDATVSDSIFKLKTSLKTAPNDWDYDLYSPYVKIEEVSGGINPYSYYLSDMYSNYLYLDTNLASVSVTFDSLPITMYDTYLIVVEDATQNLIAYEFYMVADTNSCYSCPPSLWASAQGSPVSDSTACDGTAYVEVYGGTPPYSYQFSTGSTDSTASGLCPGSYIVTVTDADSNVYNTTFVIGYPGTYYYTGGSYNYLDTLYSNAMQDCGIDYSMPIDSFYIDSSYPLSNWEYVVNWTIIQDTNQFAFTETYFIDSTGYYMFGISLYCDARSSTFGSYTFFAGAMADMSQTPAGIKDATANNSVSVYPNPSNGLFNLKASSKIESYTVYDQLGRMVSTEHLITDNQIVNMSKMPDGMYYLTVRFKDGTTSRQKILKK